MAFKFKQKCIRCKKNYVISTRSNRYVVCYDCQKKEMEGEIEDPKMKKMFDIPEEFYKANSFLRDIKIRYLRYGQLSERQIEAFEKTVVKMTEAKKEAKKEEKEGD